MKWFSRWRERKAAERMYLRFDAFVKDHPGWGSPDRRMAFHYFCQLEAVGPTAVRKMLENDTLENVTTH